MVTTYDRYAATDYLPLVGKQSRTLALSLSGTAAGHIRYVSGRAPGSPEPGLRIEAALPVRAARRLHVRAGDLLTTATQPPMKVRVTGLFAPADPASAYWPAHPQYKDAELDTRPNLDIITVGTALVDPAGYRALCAQTPFGISLTWTYTPDPGRVTAHDAPALADDVQRFGEALASERVDNAGPAVTSRFDDLLTDYVRRLRTTETLLSLSLSGLFAAALGVLALATRLLLARLGAGLAVQAARGASRRQLAVQAAGLAALVTLPAAVAGLALSALFARGPAQAISLVAVAALVVTAVALPAGGGRAYAAYRPWRVVHAGWSPRRSSSSWPWRARTSCAGVGSPPRPRRASTRTCRPCPRCSPWPPAWWSCGSCRTRCAWRAGCSRAAAPRHPSSASRAPRARRPPPRCRW